jgi:hypothetical protein
MLRTLFIVLISIFVFACSTSTKHEQYSALDIPTKRLDIALYQLDTNTIPKGLDSIKLRFGDFLDFYLDTLMGFEIKGQYNDQNPGINEGLRVLLTHHDYRGLFDSIQKHYPNTKDVDEAVKKALGNYKHYFPEKHFKEIIYFNSGLNNWGAITIDSTIGVGLDMFLGEQYPFYQSVGLPAYLAPKFNKAFIPVAVMQNLYRADYPFLPDNKSLLEMMVDKGKEMYFLKSMLPSTPEYVLLGYTKDQWEWCEKNEAMVYNFFIKNQLLYEKSFHKILKYVNEGPTSSGMPLESPGNIGAYIGLKIIEAYVNESHNLPLADVLNAQNAETILSQSKYNP